MTTLTLATALVAYLPAVAIALALAIGALALALHACHFCPVAPVTAPEGYCTETLEVIAAVWQRCTTLPTWGGELPGWGAVGVDIDRRATAADAARSDEIDAMATTATAMAVADTGCMDTLVVSPRDYRRAGRWLAARRQGAMAPWTGRGPTPVPLPCPR